MFGVTMIKDKTNSHIFPNLRLRLLDSQVLPIVQRNARVAILRIGMRSEQKLRVELGWNLLQNLHERIGDCSASDKTKWNDEGSAIYGVLYYSGLCFEYSPGLIVKYQIILFLPLRISCQCYYLRHIPMNVGRRIHMTQHQRRNVVRYCHVFYHPEMYNKYSITESRCIREDICVKSRVGILRSRRCT